MDRIEKLKEQYRRFNFRDYYGWLAWSGPQPGEGAGIMEYEALDFSVPIPLRRAALLHEIAQKMDVFIKDEELIVGHLMKKGLSHYAYPQHLSPEERPHLQQTAPVNHIIADFPKVLKQGLRGIQKQVKERLHGERDEEKITFLHAVHQACEAGVTLGRRYAAEARTRADRETHARRKTELERLAVVCDQVPAGPARTFQEALQSLYFTTLLLYSENGALAQEAYSPGRFDQFMQPFYQADLEAGRLHPDEAQELVTCLFLKFAEIAIMGGELFTLGGVTADGQDAVNDVSFLCLRAVARLKLHAPKLMVRVFEGTSEEFLRECVQTAGLGLGSPAFYNDAVALPALTQTGVPLVEARDYALLGCWEIDLPGREYGAYMVCQVNLAKCLEWALSHGEGLLEGSARGALTASVSAMTSFEDLWAAYQRQVEGAFEQLAQAREASEKMTARSTPSPFLSGLIEGCLEQAQDVSAGGARYNCTGSEAIGLANVADSLAVIQRIVFAQREMSLPELVDILRRDFAGEEPLRQRFLHAVPKYGNDEDEVDALAREVARHFCATVNARPNWRGGFHHAGLYTLHGHLPGQGHRVAALPDGTRVGQGLAHHLGAAPGNARKGPTPEAKSVAKIDFSQARDGAAFTLRLLPSSFQSPENRERVLALLRTFLRSGGMHLQFNVIDAERLKQAQKHPEQYEDLVVRVAGYSARFVLLPTVIQDRLMAETEHRI